LTKKVVGVFVVFFVRQRFTGTQRKKIKGDEKISGSIVCSIHVFSLVIDSSTRQ
jgi:hypothetical protein